MLSIFFIGLALSMDALSIALGIGTTNLSKQEKISVALMVGAMHFIMPTLGIFISDGLSFIFKVNFDILIIIIFIYAGYVMITQKNKDNDKQKLTFFNIFLLSFSVSVDSFTIGLGLKAINDSFLISGLVFFICSFVITYLGLYIGECSGRHLEDKATILGGFIFFLLALVNIIDIMLN